MFHGVPNNKYHNSYCDDNSSNNWTLMTKLYREQISV